MRLFFSFPSPFSRSYKMKRLDPRRIFPLSQSSPLPISGGVCASKSGARTTGGTRCTVTSVGSTPDRISQTSSRHQTVKDPSTDRSLFANFTSVRIILIIYNLLPYYTRFQTITVSGFIYPPLHTFYCTYNRHCPRTIIAKAIAFRVDGRHHGAAVSLPIY